MLIQYNKTNLHSFPTDAQAKHIVSLKPGVNQFPKEVWDKWKDTEICKQMIEDGDIELLEFKAEADEEKVIGKDDEPLNLSELRVKDAEAVVKQTFDVKLLEEFELMENRMTVKKAIKSQIKKIMDEGKETKE